MATQYLEHVYNTPTGHSLLLCFQLTIQKLRSFDVSKPKRSKRLFNMSCPTHPLFASEAINYRHETTQN